MESFHSELSHSAQNALALILSLTPFGETFGGNSRSGLYDTIFFSWSVHPWHSLGLAYWNGCVHPAQSHGHPLTLKQIRSPIPWIASGESIWAKIDLSVSLRIHANHKAHIHTNCFFKNKARENRSYKSMWIINPDIFPPGTHDTLFLPGCSSFTNYGGCWHPSGERITRFHRQLRITCKCHLAEWFLHGSKDTLKLLTMIAKPFISIQSQQTQKTLPTELAPVWCGSHSDIPSRLVDYLQFSFFLFYWCACYITTTSHGGSWKPRLLKIFHWVFKANRRQWMNTPLLYGDMATVSLPSKYQNERWWNIGFAFMGSGGWCSCV